MEVVVEAPMEVGMEAAMKEEEKEVGMEAVTRAPEESKAQKAVAEEAEERGLEQSKARKAAVMVTAVQHLQRRREEPAMRQYRRRDAWPDLSGELACLVEELLEVCRSDR